MNAPPKTPYLLISRIGRDSLHRQWLADRTGFDMLLSAFDGSVEPVTEPGVTFEYRAGAKVAGYAGILKDHAAAIATYRYVALFDDDLSIDGPALRRLFELTDRHGLKVAQPALTHDSYFTYACLLKHKGFVLRHVNYVEMMCPVFRADMVSRVAPLFDLGFESGIDLVWSALLRSGREDFAVIDAVPVRHTRPVGAIKAANGFVEGRIYETDITAILERFGLPWAAPASLGGLRPSGTYVRNRLALFLAACRLVTAIPTRSPRFRVVALAKYLRAGGGHVDHH